jgi:putative sugar O-methyltransferase
VTVSRRGLGDAVAWAYFKYHGLLRRVRRISHRMKRDPLLRTFDLMRSDNQGAPAAYRAGKFWSTINRTLEDLVYQGAIPKLRDGYFNRCFAGPEPESRQVYHALLWLYYKHLVTRDERFVRLVTETPVGGVRDHELIDGRAYSLDLLQSMDEALTIRDAWKTAGRSGAPRVIVELGAGYGRLGYACLHLFPESTYVALDLPEALLCSSYWLGNVFPGEAVPYGESRTLRCLSRRDLEMRRVWTLGAHQIEGLAAGCTDVFVNVYSFAEMPHGSIANYFRHIERITNGIVYLKQRRTEHNQADGVCVTEASYPVPPGWRQIFRRPSTLYEDFFEAGFCTDGASLFQAGGG